MNKIWKAFFVCLITSFLFAQQKPNIIYIYADNMGYGELGCYGQQKIKTPNLDKIAKEGIKFTQHYAGAPVCAPSRCMLMTGKFDPIRFYGNFIRTNRSEGMGQ